MSKHTQDLAAILFVASEPVGLDQLASAMGLSTDEIKDALKQLSHELSGGIIISELNQRFQLVTSPESAPAVSAFLQQEAKTELSRAALETLAIIAYRGPITKSDIEAIRGVSSDTMLKNLVQRGLIAEDGRVKTPGGATLYSVHHTFLHQFGLSSLSQLPALEGDSHEN